MFIFKQFAVIVLVSVVCAVSAQNPEGWNYNPYLYFPYTAMQPPVQDTAEVAQAKLAHAAAVRTAGTESAWSYNPYLYFPYTSQPAPVQEDAAVKQARLAHEEAHARVLSRVARQAADNLIYMVPQDSAEVHSAKQQHYQAYVEAARANGVNVFLPGTPYHQGFLPQETPDVYAAKQEFFKAYNAALARSG